MRHLVSLLTGYWLSQGTTGPKMLQRPSSRGQQHGEGNVMDAAQSQGLQSDALRTSTMREGCPQQPFRELGASGVAVGGLCGLSRPASLSCPYMHVQDACNNKDRIQADML